MAFKYKKKSPSRSHKSRSKKKRASLDKNFYLKRERCVRKLKSRGSGINPYAVCTASILGTTRYHHKSKARRSRKI